MADKKISELTNITGANLADGDELVVVDASESETKAITFGEFKTALDTSTGFVRITGDTMTGNLSFGDNDKAIFGAGSDLQIYHDGANSNIRDDSGTGALHFTSNSYVFYNAAGTERGLDILENSEVRLYFDGSEKLATTSTGVDITGTITSDGLTVNGGYLTVDNGYGITTVGGLKYIADSDNNAPSAGLIHQFFTDNGTSKAATISKGGDISFYEDTGTTAKFFWDASAESLGIGTTSPTYALDVETDNSGGLVSSFVNTATSIPQGVLIDFPNATPNATNRYFLKMEDSTSVKAEINTTGGGYFMGNVGIGTSSPSLSASYDKVLHIDSTLGSLIKLTDATSGTTANDGTDLLNYGNDTYLVNRDVGSTIFGIGGVEKMRITSSGNVGIGTSSPAAELDVVGAAAGTGSAETVFRLSQPANTISANNEIRSGVISGTSPYLSFAVREGSNPFGTVERMRIDSSGNVGIGATSISGVLTLQKNQAASSTAGTGTTLTLNGDANAGNPWEIFRDNGVTGDLVFSQDASGTRSEAMRIDSSGNLLVGLSSTEAVGTNAGTQLRADGLVYAAATSDAHILSRRSTDGSILNFRKDTTTVGSIGALSSRLYIGTAGVGLFFNNSSNAITPYDVNGQSQTDADVDLGVSSVRFRDLYLSGGVYLGGTGSANKLDDYEEGTWTPTIGSGTVTAENAWYVKVGTLITISAKFSSFSDTSSGSGVTVGGVPFTSKASDHTAQGSMIADYLSNGPYFPYISSNATTINFYIQSTTNYTTMVHSNLGSSGSFYFTLTYQTQ